MDTLSEVISFLKPRAAITGSTESYAPWAMEFSSYDYVKFGFVVEGECLLQARGLKTVRLEEGDAWVLIKPVEFTIASDLRAPLYRSVDVFKAPGPKYIVGKKSPTSKRTTIFGGRLDFDHLNASCVLENLPKIIVLKASTASTSLKSILSVLQQESKGSLMGREIMIETLIQLTFVEALRTLDFKNLRGGSLKGLAHPKVSRVLNAIHADLKRDWTVAELSKICGSSRSSFAATFKDTVGVSPMDYLLRWRMLHAKDALKGSQLRISEIAYSVGYESVTAFSTAFSRVVGLSPSEYRATV